MWEGRERKREKGTGRKEVREETAVQKVGYCLICRMTGAYKEQKDFSQKALVVSIMDAHLLTFQGRR